MSTEKRISDGQGGYVIVQDEKPKMVNILGQEYSIIWQPSGVQDPKMDGNSGYIEPWSKKLFVEDFVPNASTVEHQEAYKAKVLRHEIVHAFMQECGLRECSCGDNEEIVDWIAHQLPKLCAACKEAGAL